MHAFLVSLRLFAGWLLSPIVGGLAVGLVVFGGLFVAILVLAIVGTLEIEGNKMKSSRLLAGTYDQGRRGGRP
jgi:hypothetical protein